MQALGARKAPANRNAVELLRSFHLQDMHQMVFKNSGEIADGINTEFPPITQRFRHVLSVGFGFHRKPVDRKIKRHGAVGESPRVRGLRA